MCSLWCLAQEVPQPHPAPVNAPAADQFQPEQPPAGGDTTVHPVQTDSSERGGQGSTARAAPGLQTMPGIGQFPSFPMFPPGFMMPFPPFPFPMQNGMCATYT